MTAKYRVGNDIATNHVTMFSMRLKMKIVDAGSVFDYHHQEVDDSKDVEKMAKDCLLWNEFTHIPGREEMNEKEVIHSLMIGLNNLCDTECLTEYKKK